ncbi:extracellular solute-binding protein [Phytoactinopolyspora mesophila]|uniref:Extracellular solute-binding protein n=1 Tax=Phytoactinopolyspora mesophila TaxID=2650750 RepID=A0A7K3M7B3_9ACTN|nr:extracellular solute-binding protein [Phytoactinopolyspora mesophila]NDL59213.1 extracellular solute-binding protein [Phytoactinopolyspora mesophila]
MKRSRSTMLSAAVIGTVGLTACGGGEGGDVDSLALWLPPQANISDASDWAPILENFEDEHGVDVNVRIIPWENYEEAYLTGITGGEGPDVGLMYAEMIGDYHSQGALVPFDDYLPNSDAPDYLYLDEGQVGGEQVAIPLVVGGARVLYYNADLLGEAGVDEPPQTWMEFLEACQRLLDAGITPVQQPWGGHPGMLNETFFPLLWQAGGELFNEEGTATAFDSAEGLAAAEFLWELRESGIMTEAVTSLIGDDVEAQFTQGQTAFVFSSDARYPNFEEGDFELGFVDSLEGQTRATFVAADALVMLDKCPDKQLCADLVAYITSPEQMAQFHQLAPYPPLTEGAEYVGPQVFESFYAQPEIQRSLPIVAGSSSVYNALHTNLQQMMLGQKSPEQALTDAAEAGDRALENAQN